MGGKLTPAQRRVLTEAVEYGREYVNAPDRMVQRLWELGVVTATGKVYHGLARELLDK